MSEDDIDAFVRLLEDTICADYIDYMELLEGVGLYIPFMTTNDYLSYPSARKILKIKDYYKLLN